MPSIAAKRSCSALSAREVAARREITSALGLLADRLALEVARGCRATSRRAPASGDRLRRARSPRARPSLSTRACTRGLTSPTSFAPAIVCSSPGSARPRSRDRRRDPSRARRAARGSCAASRPCRRRRRPCRAARSARSRRRRAPSERRPGARLLRAGRGSAARSPSNSARSTRCGRRTSARPTESPDTAYPRLRSRRALHVTTLMPLSAECCVLESVARLSEPRREGSGR